MKAEMVFMPLFQFQTDDTQPNLNLKYFEKFCHKTTGRIVLIIERRYIYIIMH